MPKKTIRRLMPEPHKLKDHQALQFLGQRIHEPNLWHLNRRSVAKAFAVGLFCTFLPLPFQMAIAACGSILFKANLAISVALVWISNPLTIPAIFFFCYKIGTVTLGEPLQNTHFELTVEWVRTEMGSIWQPLLLGSLLMGTLFSIVGYFSIRIIWWWAIVNKLKKKQQRLNTSPPHEPSP
jgi:uncharacterized protein (DUF2062 family)